MTIQVAQRMARQLAEKPPLAVRLGKESVLKAFEMLDASDASERRAVLLSLPRTAGRACTPFLESAKAYSKEGAMATEVEQHVMFHVDDGIGLIQLNRPSERDRRAHAPAAGRCDQAGGARRRRARRGPDRQRSRLLLGRRRDRDAGRRRMRTPEDVGNVLRNEYMMLTRLRTMPKPVIAAMNGL
jgi:enoyl-CoA hydratase/carnithine racemase